MHVAEKKNLQDQKELINFEAASIKYYVCVCIAAFLIRDSRRTFSTPYYIVICRLSGFTVYFHINP